MQESINHPSSRILPLAVTVLAMVVFVGCASADAASPRVAAAAAPSEQAALAEVGVPMSEFCSHYHVWGGNGTTAPSSFHPCRPSDNQINQQVFCYHLHRFAANNTTYPAGSKVSVGWCNDNLDPSAIVPKAIYDNHWHDNAGTGTTGPRQ